MGIVLAAVVVIAAPILFSVFLEWHDRKEVTGIDLWID